MNKKHVSSLDLFISRDINIPVGILWKAWTTPENLKKWWAPAPLTTTECEINLIPGGIFRTLMRSHDGNEYPTQGCFLEVIENKKIVFTDTLLAGFRPSITPFFTAIITFEALQEGTRYTAHVLHKDEIDRNKHETMGFYQGWNICIDQLITTARSLQG